jgi:hypothetical protein
MYILSNWTKEDIVYSYRTAKNKEEQIEILAELTASDIDTVLMVLVDADEKLPNLGKRFKKCIGCGGYIVASSRGKRCKICAEKHDREMRRLRYHKRKGEKEDE